MPLGTVSSMDRISALGILARYAGNVTAYPEERKYRRLKTTNAIFRSLWENEEAKTLLQQCGWRLDVKPGWLVLDEAYANGAALTAAVVLAVRNAKLPPPLEEGCRVRIHSLQKKPELNGAEGIAEVEVKAKGRWRVNVEGQPSLNPLLKPSCLTVLVSALNMILGSVQPSNHTFLHNMDGFYRFKKGMFEVYSAAAPAGVLEGVEVRTSSILGSDGVTFDFEFIQQSKDGQPVSSAAELVAVGGVVLPHFAAMVQTIGAKVGGGVQVKLAPLKKESRILQKANDDYSTRSPGPAVGWVYDVVRMKFVCDSANDILRVLEEVQAAPEITVMLKAKNRFKHPTASGYRDMLLQVSFEADLGDGAIVHHICEIQIHLRAISEYDAVHDSHVYYDYFRAFFQGSMATVEARLGEMKRIVGGDSDAIFVNLQDARGDGDGRGVFERLVKCVAVSRNPARMLALAQFAWRYLEEFELAAYMFNALLPFARVVNPGMAVEIYSNVASMRRSQGKEADAAALYKTALAAAVRSNGAVEPSVVANVHGNMANLIQDPQRFDEKMHLYRQAIALHTEAEPPDAHALGILYKNMGEVYIQRVNPDAALALLNQALATLEQVLAPDAPDVITTLQSIADVLQQQGKFDEAMSLCKKVLVARVKAFGQYA